MDNKIINGLKIVFGGLLVVAIVVIAIVCKLAWLATGIAFILSLIGLLGVTMAVTMTIFWLSVKLSILWIILLITTKVICEDAK
jgi:hypothetical protein|nr:MAG TPA: hypothetical protein [Caudoviricetes sp.]